MKTNLEDEPKRLAENTDPTYIAKQARVINGMGAYATHKRKAAKQTVGQALETWEWDRHMVHDWYKKRNQFTPTPMKR